MPYINIQLKVNAPNNTTWFDNCEDANDIYMITDFEGGLLISEFGYSYPLWIYDISRSDIGNNEEKHLKWGKNMNN